MIHSKITCIDIKLDATEPKNEDSSDNLFEYNNYNDEDFQIESNCTEQTEIKNDLSTTIIPMVKSDEFSSVDVFVLKSLETENVNRSISQQNETKTEYIDNRIHKIYNESNKSVNKINVPNDKKIKQQANKKLNSSSKTPNKTNQEHRNLGSKRYVCDICQKSFQQLNKIRNHMNIHGAKCERFKCERCGRTNLTNASMVRYHNKPSVVCPLCPKRFCIKKMLKKHHIVEHCGGVDPNKTKKFIKRFQCKIEGCNELLSESNRSSHMKSKHGTGDRFECDICKKQTKYKGDIKYHILREHVPLGKKYKCDLCDRSYITKSELRVHNTRSHIKAPNYMCSECGATFVQKVQLRTHITKHTGEKPYACTYQGCTKGFRTATRRTEHMRSHTGEKPFCCPVDGCDRRFAYGIDIKRHKFNAHGIYTKQFPCQICSEIFPENMLLKKHMKKHGIQT